ncbi:MAG TPA: acetate--CoA ligase family protein [Stellaceae bacterium]|nr:acetate--CoA ligase family protein [Stellaceae bacterium]
MSRRDLPQFGRPPAPIAELMAPRSVAVIGASEDQTKFGGRLYRMLLKHGYAGTVYPINPNRPELFGLKTYPDIRATPEPADMVVMAVPRPRVAEMVAHCAEIGVRCGIIITSKFSDEGPEGAALEAEIVRTARVGGMRLIGPNCLGLISPANRVVLCSSPALEVDTLRVDPIGFASQSGALMATVFDRAGSRGIGFSHCVSVGNQADLEVCDFAEYFLEDARTQVICTYVEGFKDPARFVELARRARAAGKPWLLVKAGRTESGARAAYSHTASLAGSYQALAAVCRDLGVVMLDDLDSMVLLAASLVRFPGRKVRSATILTTSGGGGAIAADRLAETGIGLTRFAPKTEQSLGRLFSPGQARNPIDLGGRLAGGEAVEIADETMALVGADPAEDMTLALITTAPLLARTTGKIADAAIAAGKPCVFVMAPGQAADAARAELVTRRMPFTDSLDDAIRAVRGWLDGSAERVGTAPQRPRGLPAAPPDDLLAGALDPASLHRLLAAYGLPIAQQAVCADRESVCAAAARLGYPVVLKALGPALVHKSDAGGVAVDLASEAVLTAALEDMRRRLSGLDGFLVQRMVRGDAELILGVTADSQFGPQIVIGAGGILAELLKDVVVAPVPVAAENARGMLGRLKMHALLQGFRGRPPLDIDAVVDAVVRLGWLAHDLRDRLRELDVNPLIVKRRGEGCVIVDARALLG